MEDSGNYVIRLGLRRVFRCNEQHRQTAVTWRDCALCYSYVLYRQIAVNVKINSDTSPLGHNDFPFSTAY